MGRRLWSSKRVLAAGAAALALVAGTGAAVATTGDSSSSERDAHLAAVAEKLGVSLDTLKEALKGAALERLDAAVAAGRIDAERAAAIRERIQAGEGFVGFGHGSGFHGFGWHGPGFLAAAADYLGLDAQTVRDKLRSGQSLADVAKAQGKSVDGLKQAMLASVKERLDTAVKEGRLTSDQAKEILDRFQAKLDDLVNASPPAGRPFTRPHWGLRF